MNKVLEEMDLDIFVAFFFCRLEPSNNIHMNYEYINDGGQLKPEHCLVEILPEILGHKAERTEKGPAKCVEICIPVVRVITKTLK